MDGTMNKFLTERGAYRISAGCQIEAPNKVPTGILIFGPDNQTNQTIGASLREFKTAHGSRALIMVLPPIRSVDPVRTQATERLRRGVASQYGVNVDDVRIVGIYARLGLTSAVPSESRDIMYVASALRRNPPTESEFDYLVTVDV